MPSSTGRPPAFLRWLATRLVRGPETRYVLGDLDEAFERDVERGTSKGRASVRYLRNVVHSAVSVSRARRRGGMRGKRVWERIDASRRRFTLGISWLDVTLGLRMLIKHPGLTLIGVLAIAMTTVIGATTFEAVTEVLRTDLPLDEGDRVVSLHYGTDNTGGAERRILHDFVAWREELASVEQLGVFRPLTRVLVQGESATLIEAVEITASGFDVARTPPLLGRYLLPDDERDGAPLVVVIGHRVWQSRFVSDPDIVGRTINLSGIPHVVVGVMPEGFEFPLYQQLWIPFRADPTDYDRLQGPALFAFGRLAPGVTLQGAQAELTTIERRTAAANPGTYDRLRLLVHPYPREHLQLEIPAFRQLLWSAQFVVSALLIVVFANLAILVYARVVARLDEIALRSALGASRGRILTQLFVEAFVLSAVGAVSGLLLTQVLLRTIQSWMERVERIPFWIDLSLSGGTALYAFGLAVLAAVVVGVLPGLKATGRSLHDRLRQSGVGTERRLGRMWTLLIVAQVAIAVAVLPGALSTAWGLLQIELSEPGFPTEEFVVAETGLRRESLATGADQDDFNSLLRDRHVELMRRLEAEPGVSGVAFTSSIPVFERARDIEFDDGQRMSEAGWLDVYTLDVSPGMFRTYDAEILAGRAFDDADLNGEATPVVVNRRFVERLLENSSALGRRFHYRRPDPGRAEESYEIVGIVSDFPGFAPILGRDWEAKVYHPIAPGDLNPVTITVRLSRSLAPGFVGRFRQIGVEVDPAMPFDVQLLTDYYDEQLAPFRYINWVLALIMSSVLLLSAAGIHALMSFTVERRTREIGIRSALGAPADRILLSIFGRVVRQLAVGVGVGSLLSAMLFFIVESDPRRSAALLLSVAAIMSIVGLLAALGPARRGLRVQPTEALREGG